MQQASKLTGYFAGALFSAQDLYGNQLVADAINQASKGIVQIVLPQDLSTQETGEGRGTRAADYLGMIQCDFVFANMNGAELDSGTVAEYVVASMLGMPRVQFRTDFRNVGDVQTSFPGAITVCKTTDVPYNLMLGYDESALVYANSMELYKSPGGAKEGMKRIAIAAVQGIALAFGQTEIAGPEEYASWQHALTRYLKLDAGVVADIVGKKKQRHAGARYRQLVQRLKTLTPAPPRSIKRGGKK